jgi:CRISPR-associated protein (TIGR02710 family)
MQKILLVTVGGSFQPVVTAILTLKPDRVCFICSDGSNGSIASLPQVIGEGLPCQKRTQQGEVIEELPNIVTQAGLGDRFNPQQDLVLVKNPDDLSECHRCIVEAIRDLQNTAPECKIYVDYTGGTKTMSAALAIAAVDFNLYLHLTTAKIRENLIRVETGEQTQSVSTTALILERTLTQLIPKFLEEYNYPAAIAELKVLLKNVALDSAQKQRLSSLRNVCKGLDAWDRFDHQQAWEQLSPYREVIPELMAFLEQVMASRAQLDLSFKALITTAHTGYAHTGYEIVQDLLLNAQRCATQKRYDDAVGRLYRALELLAQVRLWQTYGLATNDIDLTHPVIPSAFFRGTLPKRGRKLQLPLTRSYELLLALPNDPLGQLYKAAKHNIQQTLKLRNHALFAHGFQPISHNDYQKVSSSWVKFMENAISQLTVHSPNLIAQQLPTSLHNIFTEQS